MGSVGSSDFWGEEQRGAFNGGRLDTSDAEEDDDANHDAEDDDTEDESPLKQQLAPITHNT